MDAQLIGLSWLGANEMLPQATTAAHVAASAEALTQVAEAVSAPHARAGVKPQYMRLCHYEHGGFLSHTLFGFPVMGVTGEVIDVRLTPTLPAHVRDAVADEWHAAGLGGYLETGQASEAVVLRTPEAAEESDPFTYAIVINHPVNRQIEVALAALASGLSRRQVTDAALKSGDLSELDHAIADADSTSSTDISDSIRRNGWRVTAEHIRDRSIAESRPLNVHYESVMFSQDQLALRAPALRRVYNELPKVSEAVDKVAALMSQGMTIMGDGTDRTLRHSLDALDIGAMRTYLAHLTRDAFVCGNGCLKFGLTPDSDLRLVAPEHIVLVAENRATFRDQHEEPLPVLHIAAGQQVGSLYGTSPLEPFVVVAGRRDNAT